MNKEEKNFIFGVRPIIEAIEEGKTIDKLFIQKGLHNDLFAELWKLVRLRRINYKHVPIEKINRLTRKNHQGVFAFISPIDLHKIEDVIPTIKKAMTVDGPSLIEFKMSLELNTSTTTITQLQKK